MNCKLLLSIFLSLIIGNFSLAEQAAMVSLFDGKSLSGWTAMPGGTWEVVDGAIVGKSPKSERRHGILLSDKPYKNFVVKAKFCVYQGDSGFYFRAQKVNSAVSVNGFQVEIDTSEETGGLYETGGRAWVHKPTPEVIKKRNYQPGKWNDLELIAQDGNIIVKINGVVSSELTDDPGRKEGYFGLQLHGSMEMHVAYKDLMLKEL